MSETKPVTVIARHRVRPGKDDVFQAWIEGITEECERFEGYLGTEVVHDDDEWVSIFRFDQLAHLERWMRSKERASWLDKADAFAAGPPELRSYEGIGLLFPHEQAPPLWKMSLVTFAVIWPLVHWVPPITNHVSNVPWIQEGSGVFVVVILASYVGLPLACRLFGPWLTPKRSR